MLSFLEELVRKIDFELCEIVLERCESVISSRFEQHLKLCAMHLVAIDLLMMKVHGAHNRLWGKELSTCCAQPRVGRDRPGLHEPRADRALRDSTMEAPAHDALSFSEGISEIED
jgi:hypothetical protein